MRRTGRCSGCRPCPGQCRTRRRRRAGGSRVDPRCHTGRSCPSRRCPGCLRSLPARLRT
jgi:hypothetical protein